MGEPRQGPPSEEQIQATETAMNARAPCGHWQHNARRVLDGMAIAQMAEATGRSTYLSVAPANAPDRVRRFWAAPVVRPDAWVEITAWLTGVASANRRKVLC